MTSEKGLAELLRKVGYSEKAIDYYMKKLNIGVIEGAEGVDSYGGPCGDSMRVYLKVEENVIRDAKFEAAGSVGTFASGSAVTEMIKGKTLREAGKITEYAVLKEIGELPAQWNLGPHLAIDALRKSIKRSQYDKSWTTLTKRYVKR